MANTYVDHPAKRCRFDDTEFCYHSQCDVIDSLGAVSVCPRYRGGNKFRERRAGGSPVSIFELLDGRVERRRKGF
jgi:hypothetical protein